RAGKLNMAHALTAHFSQCHFNATFFADNTAMLHALVFTTQALIVFNRAKNFGTEQTFALWLKGAVVNGLWLFDFAERPGSNHFWRSQADPNCIKFFDLSLGLE